MEFRQISGTRKLDSWTTRCNLLDPLFSHFDTQACCRQTDRQTDRWMYRVAQKIWHNYFVALTLPNINQFSNLFHYQNQEKICNNTITKDPTTPQVCRYTTL